MIPGVIVKESADGAAVIISGPSAVPVFVGKFVKKSGKPVKGQCLKYDNWLAFSADFTDCAISVSADTPTGTNALKPTVTVASGMGYWAVRHYFDNGGGPCYILPIVASAATTTATATTDNAAFTAEIGLIAAAIEANPDISLLVCTDTNVTFGEAAAGTGTRRTQVVTQLQSLLGNGKGYFLIDDAADDAYAGGQQAQHIGAYFPALITPYQWSLPADDAITLSGTAFDSVETLTALKTVADTAQAAVTAAPSDTTKTATAKAAKDQVEAVAKAIGDEYEKLAASISLGPSAAVAGAIATTDRDVGSWRAPANIVLGSVTGLATMMTDAEQGDYNEAGVNVIRMFPGRGAVVWGARTADVSPASPARYVPVRRLLDMIERDFGSSLGGFVFATNNEPNWERIRGAARNYLAGLWRQGALVGAKESEAFLVQVGRNVTMTDADLAQGILRIRIGVAPVKPAEFILLEFSQTVAGGN